MAKQMEKRAQAKTYVDEDTKNKFEALVQEYGFDSISSVLRVYMKSCVRMNTLHLDLTANQITNARTIEAIDQLERGGGQIKDLPEIE